MDRAKFQQAEAHFKAIRDERGLHANTATRIGAAFLELLYLLETTAFDEIDVKNAKIERFLNSPVFEEGLTSLASIILGNYQKDASGGMLDEDGNAELNSLKVRTTAIIHSFMNSPTFREGLRSLGSILLGNFVAGESGGSIDENGNAEFNSVIVRNGMSISKFFNKPTFMQGLITLGSMILGEYAEGLKGGIITEDAYAELKELWAREHAKIGDGFRHQDDNGNYIPALEVLGDSTFNGNLSSPDFISSFLGGLGWAIQKDEVVNAAGETETKYTLEIDNATIRGSLRVFEMIISQLLGENGNRFFSDMMEVDHYDAVSGKVWLNTHNGKLYNPFRKGDIIMVQQYNGNPSAENNWYVTKSYELRITAVGVGSQSGADRLDWVMFDHFTSDDASLTPETAILQGDTFVRADNEFDANRKGLITVMSVGDNTPYMDFIYGLKTNPNDSLKGRIGKLEGIITDVFGTLDGFGAYLNNLYAVGKFFNAQTGESMSARIEGTRARMRSIYKETTYNIPDEDNFISNGFFQNGLEKWTPCKVDGSAADAEDPEKVIGVNNSPLMVNGAPLVLNTKTTAKAEEVDGIMMLHLRAMGVSQSFADIKANGTHLEMNSSSASDTTTKNVADTLYMGVRIQPLTSGTLTVKFLKSDGTWTGWSREIQSSLDWLLYQANDTELSPWDYAGTGKMFISYSGECYIRFVAMMGDPIANSRTEYGTLFEQNSRRITLEATKQSGDLNEWVARFTLEADGIRQLVATNKQLADADFQTIFGNITDLQSDLQAESDQNDERATQLATWQEQTAGRITAIAGKWDSNGNLIGYSTSQQTADAIASALSTANSNAQGYVATLKGLINSDVLSDGTNGYASFKQQTSTSLETLLGKWDSNGNLIGYSTSLQTADAIATALSTANSNAQGYVATLKGLINSDVLSDGTNGYASFKQQTSTNLETLMGKWDSNGNLIGYSTTSQTNDAISTALGTANSNAQGYVATLKGLINSDVLSDGTNGYASFKQQTSSDLQTLMGKWDSNGNLIGYSTTQQTTDAISSAVAGLATTSALSDVSQGLSDLSNKVGTIPASETVASLINQQAGQIQSLSAHWTAAGDIADYSKLTQLPNKILTVVSNDGYIKDADVTEHLRYYSTTSQTARMITSSVRSETKANLIAIDSGWTDGAGSGDSITYDISIGMVSPYGVMYSPVFSMDAHVTYCFMAYFYQQPGGNDEIYATTMYTDDPLEIDNNRSASYSNWQSAGAQIKVGNGLYTLYYITFTCGSNDMIATVYLESNVYYPHVFIGSHPSQVSVTQGVLSLTADRVRFGIKQSLDFTGIDIENRTIKLYADKVKFTNSAGTIDDKVWIDPTTGTLHAVNGVFEGVVKTNLLYNPIKKLPNGNYTININTEAYNFYMSENGTWSDVYLPSATDYSGIIFQFFYVPGTRANLGCLRLHCQSGEYIMNLPNPSDASSAAFAATDVDIARYTPIKLISNGDNWLVLAGAEGISQVTS